MSSRRRRTSGSTDKPQQPTNRLERDYVAEVQRRLARLARESEHAPVTVHGSSLPDKQRQRIELEMASLRAEALKARRLAEQINNLSRETTRLKRKSVMTESLTTSPDQVEHESRRKADTSKSGASQLSFNPLHPSMELPPEQLIRLLGLETKKIRKGKKSHGQGSDGHFRSSTQRIERQPEALESVPLISSDSHGSRRVRDDLNNERRGILIPAIVTGALVGVAAAGYLFLSKPQIATSQLPEAGAETVRSEVSEQPAQSGDQTGVHVQPDHPVAASSTGEPLEAEKVATTPPADGAAKAVDRDQEAAIQAELARLRAQAEERFAREMSRIEAGRESREPRETAIQRNGAETMLPHQLEAAPTSEPDTNPQPQDASETTAPNTVLPMAPYEHQMHNDTSATTPPAAAVQADPAYESVNESDGFASGSATADAALTGDVDIKEPTNDDGWPALDSASEPGPVEPYSPIIRQTDPAPQGQSSELPGIGQPSGADQGLF